MHERRRWQTRDQILTNKWCVNPYTHNTYARRALSVHRSLLRIHVFFCWVRCCCEFRFVCDKVKRIILKQLLLVTTMDHLFNNIIIISSYITTALTRSFVPSSRSLTLPLLVGHRLTGKKKFDAHAQKTYSNENDQRGSNKMPNQRKSKRKNINPKWKVRAFHYTAGWVDAWLVREGKFMPPPSSIVNERQRKREREHAAVFGHSTTTTTYLKKLVCCAAYLPG